MNPWHFKFVITANMLLNGKSFVEIKRAKYGVPAELLFHRNSTVTFTQKKMLSFTQLFKVMENENNSGEKYAAFPDFYARWL